MKGRIETTKDKEINERMNERQSQLQERRNKTASPSVNTILFCCTILRTTILHTYMRFVSMVLASTSKNSASCFERYCAKSFLGEYCEKLLLMDENMIDDEDLYESKQASKQASKYV